MAKSTTERRKSSHLRICSTKNVEFAHKTTGFEDVDFIHRALPELGVDKIDITCSAFGKRLSAPFFIESITGGSAEAKRINKSLAAAAEKAGVAMGLGSQRAMIENPSLSDTYCVRDVAPDILLIGNIGIAQLMEYDVRRITDAVDCVGADAIFVHLNALQEAIQPEGNRNFEKCLSYLEKFTSQLSIPVIAKETGAGISRDVAAALSKAGVKGIDVAGAGGTSWGAVELHRNSQGHESFWEWGIPTALSVVEVAGTCKLPIIASGGIRSGCDAAKAIALGADYAGAALPFLKAAEKGEKAVFDELERWKEQLKICMFLTGCENLKSLANSPLIITGRTAELFRLRGISPEGFANRREHSKMIL
ncbi:MAG: Isopentenyl-diphosphate delta-isomerase, FMN-dependent [Candidatus Fermentimicrarchaeum limneticum]|uniref:Isopentenyl-diphosphate delta-isomerase n=1 Tax=Fermentimicrarchaeum limneticum TaxID=2795018 RepID=A0A7D6B9H2_FERL1|nr:MAG: Isopentenyl-diphosphate delta-isomerase, FMN-dependent [Candidatus Fermentimicrarchaeum limneticum]